MFEQSYDIGFYLERGVSPGLEQIEELVTAYKGLEAKRNPYAMVDDLVVLITSDLHLPIEHPEHAMSATLPPNKWIVDFGDFMQDLPGKRRGRSHYATAQVAHREALFEAMPAAIAAALEPHLENYDEEHPMQLALIDLGDRDSSGADQMDIIQNIKAFYVLRARILSCLPPYLQRRLILYAPNMLPGDHDFCTKKSKLRTGGGRGLAAIAENYRQLGSQIFSQEIADDHVLLGVNANLASRHWWRELVDLAEDSLSYLREKAYNYTIDDLKNTKRHKGIMAELLSLARLIAREDQQLVLRDIENVMAAMCACRELEMQEQLNTEVNESGKQVILLGHDHLSAFRFGRLEMAIKGHRHFGGSVQLGGVTYGIVDPGQWRVAGLGLDGVMKLPLFGINSNGIWYEQVRVYRSKG